MQRSYDLLRLEPFKYRNWEIAVLTDYQIARLIFAQGKRDEELEKRRKGLTPLADGPAEGGGQPEGDDAPPSREYMVGTMMQFGMSRENADKEYDAQLAQYEASRRR